MAEPVWLDMPLILDLHDAIISRTGGASGVRDLGLLESALERPLNRRHYEGLTDLIELAATYAVAVSSNHPFVDGNKRAAFMALGQFLLDNGMRLRAAHEDATQAMLAVAAGQLDIAGLTDWLQTRVIPG